MLNGCACESGAPFRNREPAILKSVVSKAPIGALAILIAAIPGLAAETVEWGQPVNGLRISVSIVPREGRAGDIRFALQNTGDKDLAVRIGYTKRVDGTNCKVFGFLKLFFKDGEGVVSTVHFLVGASSGPAPKPCTVVLGSGEDRSFREPTSSFLVDSDRHHRVLADIPPQRGELWVEFEPGTERDQAKAGCGRVPCWLGKVVSNTLALPVH
jgi:hypothetical protein